MSLAALMSKLERRSSAEIVPYLVTMRLGYSLSAAMRRIKAGRVAIADPSVLAKLESGELNFATSDLLSDFVKEPVLKELVAEFCGRSKEDAEKIVAPLRPMAKRSVGGAEE